MSEVASPLPALPPPPPTNPPHRASWLQEGAGRRRSNGGWEKADPRWTRSSSSPASRSERRRRRSWGWPPASTGCARPSAAERSAWVGGCARVSEGVGPLVGGRAAGRRARGPVVEVGSVPRAFVRRRREGEREKGRGPFSLRRPLGIQSGPGGAALDGGGRALPRPVDQRASERAAPPAREASVQEEGQTASSSSCPLPRQTARPFASDPSPAGAKGIDRPSRRVVGSDGRTMAAGRPLPPPVEPQTPPRLSSVWAWSSARRGGSPSFYAPSTFTTKKVATEQLERA